ncbi:hypothetical protein D9615_009867 [Tricholomella constricta]|uniref:Uncharacterized protein n=1 Tax=Tricholomella constricta TaxID=117010 RepID=A0A8H5GX53_9AGAR|nr:hypothetical protein D9615_009867 [Tricholomella constricta]
MPEDPSPPNQPPAYVSSYTVRLAVSYAYSTKFNSRGLESYWYGTYAHVFIDLTRFYEKSIVFLPQFNLYIATLLAQQERLRQEFKIAGLRWDDEIDDKNDDRDLLKGLEATNSGTRKSSRISEQLERKAKARKDEENDLKTSLRKRKAEISEALKLLNLSSNTDQGKGVPFANISMNSNTSVSEPAAINGIPDIVLSHIASVELPKPITQEDELHYLHRAGLKVFHTCTGLVGELKAPPSRAFRNLEGIPASILEAQNDLIEYCAIHFKRELKSESVVAFAAAGPFWRWAVIKKEDVPELDWLTKQPVAGQVNTFHRKFSGGKERGYFVLGTPKSDAELTEISHNHIYPLVVNGAHGGPEPKWDAENKRWYY